MVQRSKGLRRRTRRKLKRDMKDKLTVTPYLQKFKRNDKVVISIDPSSHKGMPHPMFMGRIGKVVEKRGASYLVELKIGNMRKTIISRPEHLSLKK